ncbi:tetratricopeptide repeat protein [Streptomyces sp. NPDC050617]|uniref:tetratricopeptide repeat protein n=1 Tax=Streptomyces sp. NPDC050617 TaxID=3154628 RepID=UPI003440D837
MDPHANVIGGSTQLNGPTVQARQISGGIHLHGASPPRPPVPRQLLPVSPHFTDRTADMAALGAVYARCAAASAPLIVVSGPAGVGKTALVSAWLRRTAGDFPDGQLYADLRGHAPEGAASPGEILGQFLRALGVPQIPADLAEQTALWRSVTAGLRIAVMLDNAFTAAQARPLLPGAEGNLTVVTSRWRLTGLRTDGAHFHQLGLLDPSTARELLVRGVGADRIENESAAALKVVSLCAGLPLAVCLASARLAARPRQPVRAMADALARDRRRLAVLTIEGEPAVQSALDESYAVLDAAAARLYRLLGLLPVLDFGAHAAAAACAVPLPEAERLLDALVEANLIEDIALDTHRFHDLVRLHARGCGERDESEAACGEALRRVADWYLATATEAQRLLTPIQLTLERDYAYPSELSPPFSTDSEPAAESASVPTDAPFAETEALAWLEAQRLNLMAVLRSAADRGWHSTAWQLVDAMWPLFLRRRHYDLWSEAHIIGLAAARAAGNGAAERQMLNSGAIGLSAAHRLDDAIEWYGSSLEAARAAGDIRDEGQALLGLGACHRDAGRLEQAVPYLEEAITAWEGAGYHRGTALARMVLGEIALERDEAGRAVEHFVWAHAVLVGVEGPYDVARALAFLGRARARAGAHEEGLDQLGQALSVFEATGSVHWQARTLEMLGDCARERAIDADDSGEHAAAARRFYEQALPLYDHLSPDDAARLRSRLEQSETNAPGG